MKKVAAIQMASGPNVDANLLESERLIQKAVDRGAQLVVLPENFALMGMSERDKVSLREKDGEGRIQDFLADQSRRHGLWIVGGTLPIESPMPDKVYAACLLFNDKGERVARYDKLHLFDVRIFCSGESYNESETILSGHDVVVVDTPFGRLGLAVCYDLRFPELFRHMLSAGMELIALPSAFTAITGRAHWENLIRARAIENLCYVIAAAQGGYHLNGRETWGHSMLVDPWGTVMEQIPQGSGVAVADIDKALLDSIRRNFPVINHRRFDGPLA